jgi:hypothetical protein
MHWLSAFAIFALLPSGLNIETSRVAALALPLCGQQGSLRILILDRALPAIPRHNKQEDCFKGCHSAGTRKRSLGE